VAWLKRLSRSFGQWDLVRALALSAQRLGIADLLHGHQGNVTALAFSPDGARVASGSADKSLRVWDLATLRDTVLTGPTAEITGVAFSPDGAQVAAASRDGVVRIWTLATGGVHALAGHDSFAFSLAFSPDGAHLAVGSGGGILCESLARLGADVVGIDPAPNNIAVSARHAEKNGLAIVYHCTTVETLAPLGERFDAVMVMEVVEHVKDVAGFLRDAAGMVKPGGLLVGATLNRTAKSYGLGIIGAEYILRWLPRGTHDWHKFVTPDEFEGHLVGAGLTPLARAGVAYNPLRRKWHLSRDLGCNYMVAAQRPAG
jgi:2-polyprenyl-6-hydroxyphenyl methylase/3-demethylubiquinone-9 3-methyltransferase